MTIDVEHSIALTPGGTTCLGSGPECASPLIHPLIAPRHCEISLENGQARLRDFGWETYVNKRLVSGRTVTLQYDDEIEIGPFVYQFKGHSLQSCSPDQSGRLRALGVSRQIKSKEGARFLFQDITLDFGPGDFVCILGPSGCGKSSLMNALSGRVQPTHGLVLFNDRDMASQYESVSRHLVLVEQKPLSHDDLSVEQALWFTSVLRRPWGSDYREGVDRLIEAMRLEARRHAPVAILSGGEEKRLCLANELVSGPGLIFLDEVTSGLDEQTDREMMQLFRELADEGKTILCVTHNLVNIPEFCTHVVFLTPGGRLAFVGSPGAALKYFGNKKRLRDIYPLLLENDPAELGRMFAESNEFKEYRKQRALPAAAELEERLAESRPTASKRRPIDLAKESRTVAFQSGLLLLRQVRLLGKEPWTLAGYLGQVFLVALVLWLAFQTIGKFPDLGDDKSEVKAAMVHFRGVPESYLEGIEWVRKVLNLTFLLCVTSFWLGCNNAARELVRERAIIRHEELFNLRPVAYFVSKLVGLVLIGWMQVAVLLIAVWWGCVGFGTSQASIAGATAYLPSLLAMHLAGTMLGMLISAMATSETMAVMAIPMAVIPQIILSGAIVSLTKGAAWAKVLAQLFITTYWGKRSVDSFLLETPMKFATKKETNLIESASSGGALFFILLHAVLYGAVTLVLLLRRRNERQR
ncbi:MAG: ATP-binding cassette domain-containing protein [Planctomycetaceae bacterium]|nr:ATP-binding cassette domain-containing protein [Planctomycetaceae bacterium]